jgi:ketol-acid reductoisomerase
MSKQGSDDHQQQKHGDPRGARGARVAVLGYGPEARDQAMRLRASGWSVAVGVRPGGMSWLRATEDGFAPAPPAAAVADAEVVALHVPDEDQPSVYWRAVAPSLAKGALVVFGRGHALYLGAVEPELAAGADFVLATASGTLDRAATCRVAVHHDATGRALERAISYARAAFGDLARQLLTTTVAEEVEADLAAIEERAGGPEALLAELDEMLARGTHEPDFAKLSYYERLRDVVARRATVSGSRAVTRPPGSSPSITGVVVRATRERGVA